MANSVALQASSFGTFGNLSFATESNSFVPSSTSLWRFVQPRKFCNSFTGKGSFFESAENDQLFGCKARRRRASSVKSEKFRLVPSRNGRLIARLYQNSSTGDSNALRKNLRENVTKGLPGWSHEEQSRSTQVMKEVTNVPALYFACGLLALGLSVGVCKPAIANVAGKPSTFTSTVDEKEQVELQEKKLEARTEESKVKEEDDVERKDDENLDGAARDADTVRLESEEIRLQAYLEKRPNDLKALKDLLYIRLQKGVVNPGLPILDKLVELEPNEMEWKYMRAQALEFSNEQEKARDAFQEILAIRPLSARALQGLAVIMHKKGENKQALEMLTQALKKAKETGHNKEVSNLRILLGQMHTVQGNVDEAIEQYQTIVKEDPQDYRPHLCQGLVYSVLGEPEEAEKHFKKYTELCPEDFPHRGFLDELMVSATSKSREFYGRQ